MDPSPKSGKAAQDKNRFLIKRWGASSRGASVPAGRKVWGSRLSLNQNQLIDLAMQRFSAS